MKNDKTRIADIAKELNVSVVSVSRALSGQYGVSRELRDRIIDKANEMGYAKPKNSGDLNILILHQRPYLQDHSNYSQMIEGVEQAFQKIGAEYHIEFMEKGNQENLLLPHKLAKGNYFDGVIFVGGFKLDYINSLKDKISNQLLFTGYSPPYDLDSVWFNFNNSGYKQCEYLIKKGHRSIGFVGSKKDYRNREKLIGIASALESYGLPVPEDFFIFVEDSFDEKVMDLISRASKPTALICHWDFTAIKLIKLLYEKGIRVPEDLSVIGSGNTEISSLCIPELTTLDLNIGFACETAANLLIKRINNPFKPNENISINSTLIERSSVKNLI